MYSCLSVIGLVHFSAYLGIGDKDEPCIDKHIIIQDLKNSLESYLVFTVLFLL